MLLNQRDSFRRLTLAPLIEKIFSGAAISMRTRFESLGSNREPTSTGGPFAPSVDSLDRLVQVSCRSFAQPCPNKIDLNY